MRYKNCLDCGKPLTGKQRRYCSKVCGNRHRRHKNIVPNDAKSRPNDAIYVPNEGILMPLGVEWRELTNKHKWELKFIVELRSNQPVGEWDLGLVNKGVRREIGRILLQYLAWKHPEWGIKAVEVEGNYTGGFRWPD